MTDYAGLWLSSMIRTGEAVLAMRHAGHDWREIGEQMHVDPDTARRAAALYLASDLPARMAAQEGAGEAQHRPAGDGITRRSGRGGRGFQQE